MTKIIYLGGNRITDKDLTVGKIYEKIDLDDSGSVRVHDDVCDIHSITDNAYREIIEQPINIGDTVVISNKCLITELVGKIGKVVELYNEDDTRYFRMKFENPVYIATLGEMKSVQLSESRFVLIEQYSDPENIRYEPALTDDEIKELGELLSNITEYEDAYNVSKNRYKYSKQRIKELKQKGGLL